MAKIQRLDGASNKGLKGKPVRIRYGPAAVTGDELCELPLLRNQTEREGADSSKIREVRRPAINCAVLGRW